MQPIDYQTYQNLYQTIKACTHCAAQLPLGANPVFRFSPSARLLIVGQAPGTAVHKTSIPWNDPSGKRLRAWLGMEADLFYDEEKVAIVPMGFCYPGKGKNGDLPPRPECKTLWREKIHQFLPNIALTLVIGRYAIEYYLPEYKTQSIQMILEDYEKLLARKIIALVHPSPRNQLWLQKNPWFEAEVIPLVREKIAQMQLTEA